MPAIDWSEIFEQYRGQWVAFADDERTVVASGSTAEVAWDNARRVGYAQPILTRMPKELVTYVGAV